MNSKINNFINGEFITSKSDLITVWSPQDGKILTEVTNSSLKDLDQAINAAKNAYKSWSEFTLKERVEFFFEFRNQLKILELVRNSIDFQGNG